MFFAIQTQLLLSNLEHSLLPQPLHPIPGKLTILPQEPSLVHDIFLYGPEKRDAILLQIVSISEVGHSAFQTKNTMDQRKEALSGVGRIRRIRDHMGPENGDNANGDQQPDEEDNEPDDVPPYPRSMLMLDVSDGFRVMRAMEYKRIDALKLGETALGCKVRRPSTEGSNADTFFAFSCSCEMSKSVAGYVCQTILSGNLRSLLHFSSADTGKYRSQGKHGGGVRRTTAGTFPERATSTNGVSRTDPRYLNDLHEFELIHLLSVASPNCPSSSRLLPNSHSRTRARNSTPT